MRAIIKIVVAVVGLLALVAAAGRLWWYFRHSAVTIERVDAVAGELFIIENDNYRAVLLPAAARFPLSLINKRSGNDLLAQPESVDQPNEGFRFYGGVVDSLPWVSGERNGESLAAKGLLYSAPWHCRVGTNRWGGWFEGAAEISYQEPDSDGTSRLRYVKKIKSYRSSHELWMEQQIINIGGGPARFTMTHHARTAINGYSAGDYLEIPGNEAKVSYLQYPALEEAGVEAGSIVKWPLKEATEFRPRPEREHIFLFLPATWALAGDRISREGLRISGGVVRMPKGRRRISMGVFMTNASYLLEPCLTPCIVADSESWRDENNTISLKPGESCRYVVRLRVVNDR